MRTRFGTIALLMILGTVFLCSCSDDDVVEPPIDVIPIITPISEAQLMSNFRAAYEDRDVQALTSMMHPDFLTVLQLPTIDQFPDLGPTLDRTEEIRIAQRMFSGSPVTGPEGQRIPAISSVTFQVFEQQNTWTNTGPGGDFPDTRSAIFNVMIYFDRPGASVLPVDGQIRFFVTPEDTVINGVDTTIFLMVGQQDLTAIEKAGIEEASWGSIKALYW